MKTKPRAKKKPAKGRPAVREPGLSQKASQKAPRKAVGSAARQGAGLKNPPARPPISGSGRPAKPRGACIDLCQDLMFKLFFQESEALLVSLLNSFFPQTEGEFIKSAKILNPLGWSDQSGSGAEEGKSRPAPRKSAVFTGSAAALPLSPGEKEMVLDIKVETSSGKIINIEMQASSHKAFLNRVLCYWARTYGSILKKSEKYGKLRPVYSLIFTKFDIWPKSLVKGPVSMFSIRSEEKPYFKLSGHFRMAFVELGKAMGKNLKDLVDMADLWRYTLRRGRDLSPEEQRILASKNELMREAMSVLNRLSASERVRWEEEAREMAWRDRMAREDDAREEGMAKGLAKGIAKGRIEGMAKLAEATLKLVDQGAVDSAAAKKATGFSIKELRRMLKNGSSSNANGRGK